ncbi:ferredoxin--NADP reductase [bacterium]|nr:ferredoxin--NADP reductase [bacterium]
MPSLELNAIVSQRIEVAPGLMVLRVVPDGWDLAEFRAGQFAVLGLPGSAPRFEFTDVEEVFPDPDKLIRRAYSIASAPESSDYLEFFITLVSSGALTPRLFALKPGARLWLGEKISGMFTLDQIPQDKNLILVGTGTGLAPYMSMVRGELLCDRQRRFAVLLGARHSWDLGYRSELNTLTRACETFSYLPVISRPEEEVTPWQGRKGYVQQLWKNEELAAEWGFKPNPQNSHVLLCGNPAMIEEMMELLVSDGFVEHSKKRAGQIHVEKYW